MDFDYKSRVKKVFETVSESDGFLITNIKNIRYITGFTGSFAVAVITEKDCYLLVDFRYLQQAKMQTRAEIVYFKNSWIERLKDLLSELKIKKLSFETSCSFEIYQKLKETLDIELIPQNYKIEKLRAIKEDKEIENIKQAIKKAETAFLNIKHLIKEGVTEKAIAKALEEEMKNFGSETLPFSVIVASGKNSSMPHWRSSDKTLNSGDFVIIDWGAEHNGYFSDMTRTFIIGNATEKQIEIYSIVNKARVSAIEHCKAGAIAKEIDAIARDLIKNSDYGEKFGHGLGHGVGLDVHELPKINHYSEEIITEGMVFTIEPGIYIEEFGGVRIEDMVLINKGAAVVLTTLPRDLEIL
ncbi:MAG: Xaa-Pro peptidase family protein [Thermodesulfovibrionaceae bacterium]